MKAEQILEKYAQKNMLYWNMEEFKKTHSRLYKSIIESIEEALVIPPVLQQSEQLCHTFYAKSGTTSATKCEFCGKESWEH